MEEFKLQFYFNLYKDKPFVNGVTFRKRFERMHGKFESINKLIVMIENYQIKKYGRILDDGFKSLHQRPERVKK